jgi:hypothetical protein
MPMTNSNDDTAIPTTVNTISMTSVDSRRTIANHLQAVTMKHHTVDRCVSGRGRRVRTAMMHIRVDEAEMTIHPLETATAIPMSDVHVKEEEKEVAMNVVLIVEGVPVPTQMWTVTMQIVEKSRKLKIDG